MKILLLLYAPHHELELTLKDDCYLRSDKPYFLQTVDKTYLNFLLTFLEDIIINRKASLEILCTIYIIDGTSVAALL